MHDDDLRSSSESGDDVRDDAKCVVESPVMQDRSKQVHFSSVHGLLVEEVMRLKLDPCCQLWIRGNTSRSSVLHNLW